MDFFIFKNLFFRSPFLIIFVSYISLISIFVACAGCASRPNNESQLKRADAFFDIGTSHLVNGNYPLALSNLLEAERLNPKDPIIHNNLALVYFMRQRYNEALEHINRAIRLNPKYTDARNNKGRILTDMKRYDEAIRELKIAQQDLTYPSPEKILSNLGFAYYQKRDLKNARESLSLAAKMNRDCFSYNYFGRTLYDLKEYTLAAETLDEAIRLCSRGKNQFDEPHFFSGMSYLRLNRKEQARARFKESLTLFPNGRYVSAINKRLEALE